MHRLLLRILAVCAAVGVMACKDAATTSDPKNIITTSTSRYVFLDSTHVSGGSVTEGTVQSFTVNVRNIDTARSAVINDAVLSGADAAMFSLTLPTALPGRLAPSSTMTFTVHFAPARTGPATALLTVTVATDIGALTLTDTITGTGTDAAPSSICVSATNLDFGDVRPDSGNHGRSEFGKFWVERQLIVRNCGTTTITCTDDSDQFPTAKYLDLSGQSFNAHIRGGRAVTLRPSDSAVIDIRFSPNRAGSHTGTLTLGDPMGPNPVSVHLSGTSDPSGYPLIDKDDSIVVQQARPDTGIWVVNPLPFPITLVGADPAGPGPALIQSAVNYAISPVMIAPGDSLYVRFSFAKFTASRGRLIDQLLLTFREASPSATIVTGVWW